MAEAYIAQLTLSSAFNATTPSQQPLVGARTRAM